jgi:hypothetical protein
MSDVSSARKAKEQLKASIGHEPWCVGVGVEREDGVGFIVRVSVHAGIGAEQRSRIPERLSGVLIKVVEND